MGQGFRAKENLPCQASEEQRYHMRCMGFSQAGVILCYRMFSKIIRGMTFVFLSGGVSAVPNLLQLISTTRKNYLPSSLFLMAFQTCAGIRIVFALPPRGVLECLSPWKSVPPHGSRSCSEAIFCSVRKTLCECVG